MGRKESNQTKQHIASMPSEWSAIANPHCKGFDPSTPKSHPWGMTQATEWKFGSIFNIFYLWAHTQRLE